MIVSEGELNGEGSGEQREGEGAGPRGAAGRGTAAPPGPPARPRTKGPELYWVLKIHFSVARSLMEY